MAHLAPKIHAVPIMGSRVPQYGKCTRTSLDPDQPADAWRRPALRSAADIRLSTMKKKPANAAAPTLPTSAPADATFSLPVTTANASHANAARWQTKIGRA